MTLVVFTVTAGLSLAVERSRVILKKFTGKKECLVFLFQADTHFIGLDINNRRPLHVLILFFSARKISTGNEEDGKATVLGIKSARSLLPSARQIRSIKTGGVNRPIFR
jgi:hypothetical protein